METDCLSSGVLVSNLYGNTEVQHSSDDVRELGTTDSNSQVYRCFEEKQHHMPCNSLRQTEKCPAIQAQEYDNMSFTSSQEDPEVTAVVIQQFDYLLHQRVDVEMELFKESIHRIISEQHLQFREAFNLPEINGVQQTEPMHVVPQSNHCEDTSSVSDECQVVTLEDKSDTSDGCLQHHLGNADEQVLRAGCEEYTWDVAERSHSIATSLQQDLRYEQYQLCEMTDTSPECRPPEQTVDQALNTCLLRMMTSSSVISETLRRQEFAP
ncbi:uncharacterized protein LOC116616851 isoform X2 [Nematostella vectensis]|uniref:uncharacterized protein LOC116616851 isoform X2 n=1 Tax=Nematostella vectensis TaxID=45351 RepID=UPI0020773C56|nr:uncharacterized protein LOC116616851 isoform X2 [Nematostella vectensis]